MIVRHDEVAFDFRGFNYEAGIRWKFSGTATIQPEGHYKVDHIDDDDLQTIIYILKPKCSLEECATEGFWYEKTKGYEPEIWKFSGTLEIEKEEYVDGKPRIDKQVPVRRVKKSKKKVKSVSDF